MTAPSPRGSALGALEPFLSLGKNHPEHVSGQHAGIGIVS
jgi:hypothetical protein